MRGRLRVVCCRLRAAAPAIAGTDGRTGQTRRSRATATVPSAPPPAALPLHTAPPLHRLCTARSGGRCSAASRAHLRLRALASEARRLRAQLRSPTATRRAATAVWSSRAGAQHAAKARHRGVLRCTTATQSRTGWAQRWATPACRTAGWATAPAAVPPRDGGRLHGAKRGGAFGVLWVQSLASRLGPTGGATISATQTDAIGSASAALVSGRTGPSRPTASIAT